MQSQWHTIKTLTEKTIRQQRRPHRPKARQLWCEGAVTCTHLLAHQHADAQQTTAIAALRVCNHPPPVVHVLGDELQEKLLLLRPRPCSPCVVIVPGTARGEANRRMGLATGVRWRHPLRPSWVQTSYVVLTSKAVPLTQPHLFDAVISKNVATVVSMSMPAIFHMVVPPRPT